MYKKLGVVQFGKALLVTADLDPIYSMLWNAKLHPNHLKRWLLAQMLFDHAGSSTHLSQYKGRRFFDEALDMASGTEAKRGKARRHFRGQKAIDTVKFFRQSYKKPEYAIDDLIENVEPTVGAIIEYMKHWPMFGPWAGFKIADMLERLDLSPIEFPVKAYLMPKEPREAAELVAEKYSLPNHRFALTWLLNNLAGYKAPPRYERAVAMNETETVLCKWKAHMQDDYPIGKIIVETQGRLKGYGPLAKKLSACLPKRMPEWQL